MKRNIALGILFIGAIALSSCSTQKLASTQSSDDVYFSKAKAADEPVYTAQPQYAQNAVQDDDEDNDDYFYYDDYSSRINRFSYASPFGYYDNLYYGYGNYLYSDTFSLGFNYGPFGYGYSPYSYGYGGWGLGYGYGFYRGGYGGYYGGGYGGGGYYGGGGRYTAGNPRPSRGTGSPYAMSSRNGSTASSSRNNGIGYIPGGRDARPTVNSNGTRTAPSSYARPARTDAAPSRSDSPVAQESRPVSVDRSSSSPAPSSSSGGSRSSGGGGGGGGGGRPVRP